MNKLPAFHEVTVNGENFRQLARRSSYDPGRRVVIRLRRDTVEVFLFDGKARVRIEVTMHDFTEGGHRALLCAFINNSSSPPTIEEIEQAFVGQFAELVGGLA